MRQVDVIIHNSGQLATCASGGKAKRTADMLDVGVVENGAVAIADGRFVGVGTTADILGAFSSDDVVDADGRAVVPGFVDPHTHIVYAGDRLNEFELKIKGADYLEILTSGGGIISTVRNTREASVEELVELALERLDKMLLCGTTTCEIKTGYGLDIESELKMLAVIDELSNQHPIEIIPTLLAAHAIPPEFKDNSDAYVELICGEILPKAWNWYENSQFYERAVPFSVDVFAERNTYTIEQSRRLFEVARCFGFQIKAHVDQFTNLGGSRLGIDYGALSIDHLDAISDDEIELLADSDTVGVVIPTENFSAGKSQFANARKMIDAGCAIAISTDYNPGSAPCPSMPMAMAISCRYQKLLPSEVLNASTINAAHAIGLGEHYGSIEVGKVADALILETKDFRALMYEFGGNIVDSVIKNGEVL
ncbi:MAG TPA: imidazolonepropionase [Pyrinomonadaceae bacterium]|nr:imidazolonepropionase [Pyrinomonadaceae bacterium]